LRKNIRHRKTARCVEREEKFFIARDKKEFFPSSTFIENKNKRRKNG
jgi:hypothetical protein